jgi:glycine dehydrogenase subunit 1
MMCQLTAMDVSNASLYDGASGLAEAVLMSIRGNRKSKSRKVLVASGIHPLYEKTVNGIVSNQGISIDMVALGDDFRVDQQALAGYEGEDYAALVIAQPNFYGSIEDVNVLTDWAHAQGMLVIAVVNPTALALLVPPGEWGTAGADIVVGEGQPLGLPLASGGPYFGFICCTNKLVRQMPGRIIGRTLDLDGKEGFTLTLQAREQHIRRSKATSNICTNQGLAVTAATIYMTMLGYEGLSRVAKASHANAKSLAQKLVAIEGVELLNKGPFFHEFMISVPGSAQAVLDGLAERSILGGVAVASLIDGADAQAILVCATEVKTTNDLDIYACALRDVLDSAGEV